ncbi:MAG: alpha/beta hydrolase [Flavobacteriaceae bacterium]|nr:alpha/beta hydrolase [Flavobacteriaceae bacterium]
MKNSYNNFFKTTDGEQIFYTTNFKPGDVKKHVLVFNYGLVCSNYHWKHQIEYFSAKGYSILLHDYRGHYQSSGSHNINNITINQIAKDLAQLIEYLELSECVLFGHSMGVNVSLEYAKLHQAKIKSMILISGTILPVHNVLMNTNFTAAIKPFILKLLEKYPNEVELFWKFGGWNPILKKIIHLGGFNVDQVSNEFIEVYLNKIGQLGPDLFFQLIGQMHEHNIMSFISAIDTKSLIIGGNKDKVIPNYVQRLMHEKLINSELYVIHAGSHVPQVDFPNEFNERVEFFIESNL